ncbi:zinc dependent phospholipase C family protein [Gallaecimonas sp. GXIMD4217]|uniref:zinc dependent phospholipase C family protein n=1 Tax=Gallaecimonas sp. GXIMD4217 TaxID=3131927 RepID=UPI00311B2184
MPGAYAHLTLVNLLREPARLEARPDFPLAAIAALMFHFKYCELGAVSPDYPYLALENRGDACRWADLMHYEDTGAVIHQAVAALRELSGHDQQKGLAWLLGYTAHVVADVTIHPVIERKVGPYHDNQRDHRVCEMHQDAHIFRRLRLGEIGLSEHLDSGIGRCGAGELDPLIAGLWSRVLGQVHPGEYQRNPPQPAHWHRDFNLVVDNIAEEGNRLLPFARHLGVKAGLTYPRGDEVDDQYLKALDTPAGPLDYDAIFDRALANVCRHWALVASAVLEGDDRYLSAIGNWNLDTGRDPAGRLVMWEDA